MSKRKETRTNIVRPAAPPPSPELIAHFRKIVGDKYAVTDAADIAPYVTEERDLFHGRSPLVLRPKFLRFASLRASIASRWCRRAAIPGSSAVRLRTMARWSSRCGG